MPGNGKKASDPFLPAASFLSHFYHARAFRGRSRSDSAASSGFVEAPRVLPLSLLCPVMNKSWQRRAAGRRAAKRKAGVCGENPLVRFRMEFRTEDTAEKQRKRAFAQNDIRRDAERAKWNYESTVVIKM